MPSFFQGDPGHLQRPPPATGPGTPLPSRPVGDGYRQHLDLTWESLDTGSLRLTSPTATHSLQNRLGTQGFSSRSRLEATTVRHDAFPSYLPPHPAVPTSPEPAPGHPRSLEEVGKTQSGREALQENKAPFCWVG